MKLTYLGTAAAEGFPAIFCNCPYCVKARKEGGKNIRTRSQALINTDFLIDFPADTYFHFLQNGIEGDKIKYLLVTHSHMDHFYYEEFILRHGAYAHDMREKTLEVFCGKGVYEKFQSAGIPANIEVTLLSPYQRVCFGDYAVTPLPARHMEGDGAYIYIIEGEKKILYAHDTGYFFDEVFDYIQKNEICFDMISFDCTHVDTPVSDEGSHMGLENIGRAIERFRQTGAVSAQTVMYINHFSHNANPMQDLIEEKAKAMGLQAAFDGCCVALL